MYFKTKYSNQENVIDSESILKNLSTKSVRIKASIQLKYLKYKLNDYLGTYSPET